MKEYSSMTPWSLQDLSTNTTAQAFSSQPAFVALQGRALHTIGSVPFRGQLEFSQQSRSYSSGARKESEDADLEAARAWYRNFNQSTIPAKVAKTTFIRSSGAGGQKVNKTSSKAATTWGLDSLLPYTPKILHQEIRESRYYVRSSNSIAIQSDTHRSRDDNAKETYAKLFDEITKLYKDRVPGATTSEQKKKVEELRDSLPRIPYLRERSGQKDSKTKRHNLQRVQVIKNAKKHLPKEAKTEIGLEASRLKRAAKEQRERESWKKPKK